MKLLQFNKDGGKESNAWAFWLIEWKAAFSIGLLTFTDKSREAYHSHAFNSWSWVLRGRLEEEKCFIDQDDTRVSVSFWTRRHRPSWYPVFISRDDMHKVSSVGRSWVFTVRGPWADTWREWLPAQGRFVTLTHGRQIVG